MLAEVVSTLYIMLMAVMGFSSAFTMYDGLDAATSRGQS